MTADSDIEAILSATYAAFNARDIEAVLACLDPRVDWANGWEGGSVIGHDAVRDYWQRQWKAIDPHVEPVGIFPGTDGEVVVEVLQTIRDLSGHLLSEGRVRHLYLVKDGLISRMRIGKP